MMWFNMTGQEKLMVGPGSELTWESSETKRKLRKCKIEETIKAYYNNAKIETALPLNKKVKEIGQWHGMAEP